ncbi:hypothetical protein BDV27DRAFT_160455 [Aspergillus caelatus]|uniref:Uncharacterized protein n=1 Tax=Aspergillus caelatus TaxID=61420 RepID=A0A5N6ZXT0_9EURO|nr:uncharacterized protein BDV27DRAFT_160455 [Aspergillus caelatus]KAE8361709.1 hypothetical protein BDV27DRAFT_160455 [Aspergillus caelatus]
MLTGYDRLRIQNLLNPDTPHAEHSPDIVHLVSPTVSNLHGPSSKVTNQGGVHCSDELDSQRSDRQTKAWIKRNQVLASDVLHSQPCQVTSPSSHVTQPVKVSLDHVRALRVVELMNDYRTLLIHILNYTTSVPSRNLEGVGYAVLGESLIAAHSLLTSSYSSEASSCDNDYVRNKQLTE